MKINISIIKRMVGIVLICLIPLSLTACSAIKTWTGTHDESTIFLASVGPQGLIKELGFQEGMDLALAEVNAQGLVAGKYTLQVNAIDDRDDLTTGMRIAQQLVSEAKYTAVIGHWTARVALPTAKIYENGNLLALSPAVSNIKLTQADSNYIFRTCPSDKDEIQRIMEYIQPKGYQRIAVCYADTEYGKGLVELLTQACKDQGITITDIHQSFVSQSEFEQQYDKWMALDTEAVFIADSLPSGTEVIKMIRSQSSAIPILSVGGFSFADVNELLGGQADNIIYVDPYYHNQEQDKVKKFNAQYQEKYGKEPGQLSIDGYDLVHRLADAIEKTDSTEPAAISKVLKSKDNWQGIADSFHFDAKGNVMGKKLTIVEVISGKYTYQK